MYYYDLLTFLTSKYSISPDLHMRIHAGTQVCGLLNCVSKYKPSQSSRATGPSIVAAASMLQTQPIVTGCQNFLETYLCSNADEDTSLEIWEDYVLGSYAFI